MIQDAINHSELPLLSASVEAVSPTQVRFGLSTELENAQAMGVTLDAFPLELYNTDSETRDTIATLAFPEQVLDRHTTTAIDVAPQTLEIQSQTELRAFLAKAFQAEQTSVGVRGITHARVLGGSYAVTLDKEVSLAGLHNLEGMQVDTLIPAAPSSLLAEDDPAAVLATINGSLTVPNPSKLNLALGDVTYKVYSAGVLLGESHVNDLRLVPGNQALPYEGTLNVDDIIDKENEYATFAKIMNATTDDGRVPFEITGSAAYVNGEHIEYLDEVLSKITLRVAPCMDTTQEAIPLDKQDFKMMDYIPLEKEGICDPNAPVS